MAICSESYKFQSAEETIMNKQETYDYLTAQGIRYEITEHAAVYNMAELDLAPILNYRDIEVRALELHKSLDI